MGLNLTQSRAGRELLQRRNDEFARSNNRLPYAIAAYFVRREAEQARGIIDEDTAYFAYASLGRVTTDKGLGDGRLMFVAAKASGRSPISVHLELGDEEATLPLKSFYLASHYLGRLQYPDGYDESGMDHAVSGEPERALSTDEQTLIHGLAVCAMQTEGLNPYDLLQYLKDLREQSAPYAIVET